MNCRLKTVRKLWSQSLLSQTERNKFVEQIIAGKVSMAHLLYAIELTAREIRNTNLTPVEIVQSSGFIVELVTAIQCGFVKFKPGEDLDMSPLEILALMQE